MNRGTLSGIGQQDEYQEEWQAMPARVEDIARALIEQHGTRAAHAAVERLNHSIDERDQSARDVWAQVVHAIHEYKRSVASQKRAGRNSRRARQNPTVPNGAI